jgi:SAM-dependent methyltransferase
METGPQQHALDGDDAAPRGLRWRLTAPLTRRSRRQRLSWFMTVMMPGPSEAVLDVGVIDTVWRASNFLEDGYPWPERITAVGLEDMPTFRRVFPSVSFVVADGRELPFADQSFDIGFSNAVIEHVGSRDQQRQFVSEMLRTCRRVFIATPNAKFPIDPHTLIPMIHWLPRRIWHRLLRWTGNGQWASEAALHPLSAPELTSLFPASAEPRLHRQRLLGLTSVLSVSAGRPPTDVAP